LQEKDPPRRCAFRLFRGGRQVLPLQRIRGRQMRSFGFSEIVQQGAY